MASSMLASMLPQGLMDFEKVDYFNGSVARSRSTSAGRSSFSDSQGSLDLQKALSPPLSPPVYHADSLGLPEYDYPTPWSIQQAPPLPNIDYPQPFIMKNTFMGFDVCRPPSLEEFYEERLTKSCPVSGIGLPPGLEDLVEPEEAAARLVAAEFALRREMAGAEVDNVTQATYHLPDGLFEAPLNVEAPEFCPALPQPVFDFSGQQFDVRGPSSSFSPTMQAAEPLPLLLDSLVSLLPAQQQQQAPYFDAQPQQPQQAPYFDAQLAASCPPAPASWSAQPTHSLPEPELGSPECPTLGSLGHQVGNCRPCAFLYTKGCSNGVSCSFCHLCDAGEKKRRMKEKRAAIKTSRQWGC